MFYSYTHVATGWFLFLLIHSFPCCLRVTVTDPCSLSGPVQFRNTKQHLCRKVFVHYPKHDGWCGGKEEVEKNQQPVVDHGSAREAAEELIPEQQVHVGLGAQTKMNCRWLYEKSRRHLKSDRSYKTHHILIEEVNDHVSKSSITPVSMNQEKFFQVFEVRYSKITGHDCLQKIKSFRQWE